MKLKAATTKISYSYTLIVRSLAVPCRVRSLAGLSGMTMLMNLADPAILCFLVGSNSAQDFSMKWKQ